MDNQELIPAEGTVDRIKERFGYVPELDLEAKSYRLAELDLEGGYFRLEPTRTAFPTEYQIVGTGDQQLVCRRQVYEKERGGAGAISELVEVMYWPAENYQICYTLSKDYRGRPAMRIRAAIKEKRTLASLTGSTVAELHYPALMPGKEGGLTFITPYFDAAIVAAGKQIGGMYTDRISPLDLYIADNADNVHILYFKPRIRETEYFGKVVEDGREAGSINFGEWFEPPSTSPFHYRVERTDDACTFVKANSAGKTYDTFTFPRPEHLDLANLLILAKSDGREWGNIFQNAMLTLNLGVSSINGSPAYPELPPQE